MSSGDTAAKFIQAIGESDGAIVHVGPLDIAVEARRAWRDCGTPVVLLYGGRFRGGPPQVGTDDVAIGRMAAEHFLDRGFEHFAYLAFGKKNHGFSTGRLAGFRQVLRQRGFAIDRYSAYVDYLAVKMNPHQRLEMADVLVPWVASLPKPVAIFDCDDARAAWVAEAAAILDLHVPEDVAILGANNDEVRCLGAWPPVSSIRVPARLVGFRAAELMCEMLACPEQSRRAGKTPSSEPVLLPPEGVEVRQSTDTTAISDPRIAAAVRYIRDHACNLNLNLDAIAEQATLSESHLLKLFKRYLGRSPFAEMRRVQLDTAKRLLIETNATIDDIARQCRLSQGSYFSRELKKQTNLTPHQYRNQFRRT